MLGIAILIALACYEPTQSSRVISPQSADTPNPLGLGGANLVFYLFAWLGIGAWCVPWILLTAAYLCFADLSKRSVILKMSSTVVFCFSLSVLADAYREDSGEGPVADQTYWKGAGGTLGGFLYSGITDSAGAHRGGFLNSWIGPFGTGIIMSTLLLGSLAVYLSARPNAWFDKAFEAGGRLTEKIRFKRDGSQRENAADKPKSKAVADPIASVNPGEEENDSLFGHVEPLLEQDSSNNSSQKRKTKESTTSAAETDPIIEDSDPEEDGEPEPEKRQAISVASKLFVVRKPPRLRICFPNARATTTSLPSIC
ncbi:MAG: DNA translocase FtsK 4TM domain-containing protein [Opitutales bacterium]